MKNRNTAAQRLFLLIIILIIVTVIVVFMRPRTDTSHDQKVVSGLVSSQKETSSSRETAPPPAHHKSNAKSSHGRSRAVKHETKAPILRDIEIPAILSGLTTTRETLLTVPLPPVLSSDTKAPTNTTPDKFINNGAEVTSAAQVSLELSATDTTGVSAYHVSEINTTPPVTDRDWVEIVSTKSYSAKVDYTLAGTGDGKKRISVRFKDAAGNVSEAKSGVILLHTAKPVTTITRQPENPTNSTAASFGFVADKKNVTFQCSLDTGEYSACVNNAQNYEGLSAGPHTFTVKAIDKVGNVEAIPASYAWTIDTSPPDTTITTQPTLTTNTTSASFGFSSPKMTSAFYCKLDSSVYEECSSPRIYTALAAGSHTFLVRAMDRAGNIDPTPASYSWNIELFQAAITSQPSNPSGSNSAQFSFQSVKNEAAFECKLDHGDYSACSSPIAYSGLTEGLHTFTVKTRTNDSGIEEAEPAQYQWVVSMPPLVKTHGRFINRASVGITDKNSVTLSLAASSAKGVAGYYASERPVKPVSTDAGWVKLTPAKDFSREVPFTFSESKGEKVVYVWFKDAEGNVSDVVSSSIYFYNSSYVLMLLVLLQVAVLL